MTFMENMSILWDYYTGSERTEKYRNKDKDWKSIGPIRTRTVKTPWAFSSDNENPESVLWLAGEFWLWVADWTQEAVKWWVRWLLDTAWFVIDAAEWTSDKVLWTKLNKEKNFIDTALEWSSAYVADIDMIHSAADDTEFWRNVMKYSTAPMYFVGTMGWTWGGVNLTGKWIGTLWHKWSKLMWLIGWTKIYRAGAQKMQTMKMWAGKPWAGIKKIIGNHHVTIMDDMWKQINKADEVIEPLLVKLKGLQKAENTINKVAIGLVKKQKAWGILTKEELLKVKTLVDGGKSKAYLALEKHIKNLVIQKEKLANKANLYFQKNILSKFKENTDDVSNLLNTKVPKTKVTKTWVITENLKWNPVNSLKAVVKNPIKSTLAWGVIVGATKVATDMQEEGRLDDEADLKKIENDIKQKAKNNEKKEIKRRQEEVLKNKDNEKVKKDLEVRVWTKVSGRESVHNILVFKVDEYDAYYDWIEDEIWINYNWKPLILDEGIPTIKEAREAEQNMRQYMDMLN